MGDGVWALSDHNFSPSLEATVEKMPFNNLSIIGGTYSSAWRGPNGFLKFCVDADGNVWGNENNYLFMMGYIAETRGNLIVMKGWWVDAWEGEGFKPWGRWELRYETDTQCVDGEWGYGNTKKIEFGWNRLCLLNEEQPCTAECMQPFDFLPGFSVSSILTADTTEGINGDFILNENGTLSLCTDKKGRITGGYRLPNSTEGYIEGQCYLSGAAC